MLFSIISVIILTMRDSGWFRHFFAFRHVQVGSCLKSESLSEVYNNDYRLNEAVDPNPGDDRYKAALDASLYANLQKLMEQEKIYRDPNLSRDIVVARLGTSKKVFLEVLQRNINMNFIDYINTYRLSDAINLLQESEYTNETIAAEVGFGSVNTFYRQFRSKYGCSPAEYKKSILLKSINENPFIEGV